MAYGTRVQFEAVREVAFGSITASYTALGTATLDHTRLFNIVNTTDVDIYISLNGTTNHLRIAANSFLLLDLTANKVQDDGLFVDVGTIFYIKRAAGAPSQGNVWIDVMYAGGGV